MTRRARRALPATPLPLLLLLTVTGCAGSPATGPAVAATGGAPTYRYPLAGGDKVRVIVYGDPALGGDYTISGAGSLAMPLIGDVPAQGATAPELQARITARLADGYLIEPRVAVEVLSTRPYYILGEVNRPGEYAFTDGLTVASAVAKAGGYTYRAKTRRVLVQHAGADTAQAIQVEVATPVAPGDTIRVPERWF